MKPPFARNIAEVIDDLYRQHAPPRNHERMIEHWVAGSDRARDADGGCGGTATTRPRRSGRAVMFRSADSAQAPVNPSHQSQQRAKVWRN
jgi:hypothetical protein